MKNIFAITLICLALALFASCGSVVGGYEGPVDVSGDLYGRGENIMAVVEKKGGTHTINFTGSGFIKNCKLDIYPSEKSSAGSGQTCEISPAGETEIVTVDRAVFFDESNAGLKAIRVIITGKTRGSGSGKDVEVTYKGFNSK